MDLEDITPSETSRMRKSKCCDCLTCGPCGSQVQGQEAGGGAGGWGVCVWGAEGQTCRMTEALGTDGDKYMTVSLFHITERHT